MAIAFDADDGSSDTGGAATSLTYSHTCSGTDRILFVSVGLNTNGDNVTGVTYNGVAMTQIATATANASNRSYLYYLINPATGSNNVVVSLGSASNVYSSSASYTGAKQSTQPDSNATNTTSSTPLTLSTTVVGSGCWIVSTCMDLDGQSPGTGTTGRTGASTAQIGDSNGVVGSGSQSLGWTVTDTSNPSSGVIASFLPSQGAGGGSFLINFV